MTSPDVSWKLVVKGLKSKLAADRKDAIRAVMNETSGEPVSVRTARRFLLTMVVDALAGRPRSVNVHGEGVVLLIAAEDFLEVLADPPPTLAEVLGRETSAKLDASKVPR
jgi:hypothetical protein